MPKPESPCMLAQANHDTDFPGLTSFLKLTCDIDDMMTSCLSSQQKKFWQSGSRNCSPGHCSRR